MNSLSLGRRKALQLMSGAGLGALAGCCCRSSPISMLPALPASVDSMNPALRPLQVSKVGQPASYCLDAHTHFFNGSDVNAEGYFAGGVARSLQSTALQDLAKLIAPLLDGMTEDAPTASMEYATLQSLHSRGSTMLTPGVHPWQDQIDAERESISGKLSKRLTDSKLRNEFIRLRNLHASRLNPKLAPTQVSSFDDFVAESVDPKKRLQSHRERFGTETDQNEHSDPGGIIEFLGHMLSNRYLNLRTYQEYYTEDTSKPGIDGVFASMVDFDHWLDCPTESSREDQVKLHRMLSVLSGGYMLPLVPYNPWTDILTGGGSLALIQSAITQYGYIGVKIYPSNGFFPYGNANMPVKTSQPRPVDLAALDKYLLAMFTWCADNQVPVMAHTDETMGADTVADEFAGMPGWQALLNALGDNRTPVINLGHFGGDYADQYHPGSDWSKDFAGLMTLKNASKVYGDIAYWSALCTCGEIDKKNEAMGRLSEALAVPGVADRLMYGTDWFMTSTLTGWPVYMTDLITNLKTLNPAPDLQKMFYSNAIACFGLDKGGPRRANLEKFYANTAGGLPAWLPNRGPVAA